MFKLSISNIAWDPQNNNIVFSLMCKYGFTGLEIAPSIIVGPEPYKRYSKAKEFAVQLYENYGISICSMQSIWYGRKEELFKSQSHKDCLMQYTMDAINFAQKIHCPNLVFGCPKNRNTYNPDDYQHAVNFFGEIGQFAYSSGTVLSMEANPAIYGTNFLNGTKETLDFVKRVNSPGIQLNLDLGTMIFNNEEISLLNNQMPWIHHIHISEPELKNIKARQIHKEIKNILLEEQYQNYLSVEMKEVNNLHQLECTLSYISDVFGKI